MTNENNDEHEGCNHTDEEHKQMYGDQLGGLLGVIRQLGELAKMTEDDGDPEVQKLSENMVAHRTEAAAMLDRALKKDSKDKSVFFDPTLMAAVQLLIEKLIKGGVFDVLDMVNLAKFAAIMVHMTAETATRVHGERDVLETMLAGIEIDL